MAKASDADYTFSFILVGNAGVGKTSLTLRFADNTFADSTAVTLGADTKSRIVQLDGKRVKVTVRDSAGTQERFQTVTSSFYRGCHGALLCYDITSAESLASLKNTWAKELERFSTQIMTKILVGTKTDLEAQRVVQTAEAAEYASLQNFQHFETSSKTGSNVDDVFVALAKQVLQRALEVEKKASGPNFGSDNSDKKKKKKGGCTVS